jgi:hypothetical protein
LCVALHGSNVGNGGTVASSRDLLALLSYYEL